jgi:hypothetical protein
MTEKGGEVMLCLFFVSLHGRFLISTTSIATPMMIMTIMIAATPNSTVDVDARPVGGAAVGAGVGGGLLA